MLHCTVQQALGGRHVYSIVLQVDVQACKWPKPQSQLQQFSILLLFLSFFTTADDWKCDQIHWRHYGRKKLKTDPVILMNEVVLYLSMAKDLSRPGANCLRGLHIHYEAIKEPDISLLQTIGGCFYCIKIKAMCPYLPISFERIGEIIIVICL